MNQNRALISVFLLFSLCFIPGCSKGDSTTTASATPGGDRTGDIGRFKPEFEKVFLPLETIAKSTLAEMNADQVVVDCDRSVEMLTQLQTSFQSSSISRESQMICGYATNLAKALGNYAKAKKASSTDLMSSAEALVKSSATDARARYDDLLK